MPTLVAISKKRRRFDPEQRRLERIDTYTKTALAGAGVATGAAVVDSAKKVGAAGHLRQMKQASRAARGATANNTAMRTYMPNIKASSRGAEGAYIKRKAEHAANFKAMAAAHRKAALRTAFVKTPNLKRLGVAGGLVAGAAGLQGLKRSDRFQPYQGYRTANRPGNR